MAIPCPPFITSEKLTSMESTISSSSPLVSQDELKRIDAYEAVDFVQSGMVLGLGTGSITKHVVDRIAALLHQDKFTNIIGIPTSKTTQKQALSHGIPLSDLDSYPVVDLPIDGAEVYSHLNLVK